MSTITTAITVDQYIFQNFFLDKNRIPALVVSVYDGDTFTVIVKNVKFLIRMKGIDCPEIRKTSSSLKNKSKTFRKSELKIAKIAKKFLVDNFLHKTIYLGEVSMNDKYGRILANVYASEKEDCDPISNLMIKSGIACIYSQLPENWETYYHFQMFILNQEQQKISL